MSINKLLDLDSLNDQEIVQIANYRYKHLGNLMKMRSDDQVVYLVLLISQTT